MNLLKNLILASLSTKFAWGIVNERERKKSTMIRCCNYNHSTSRVISGYSILYMVQCHKVYWAWISVLPLHCMYVTGVCALTNDEVLTPTHIHVHVYMYTVSRYLPSSIFVRIWKQALEHTCESNHCLRINSWFCTWEQCISKDMRLCMYYCCYGADVILYIPSSTD